MTSQWRLMNIFEIVCFHNICACYKISQFPNTMYRLDGFRVTHDFVGVTSRRRPCCTFRSDNIQPIWTYYTGSGYRRFFSFYFRLIFLNLLKFVFEILSRFSPVYFCISHLKLVAQRLATLNIAADGMLFQQNYVYQKGWWGLYQYMPLQDTN